VIDYSVTLKRWHEKGRSVSRAAFVGAGGLLNHHAGVLDVPASRLAEGLCVQDPVAAHLNHIPNTQGRTLIRAPAAELVLGEALIGSVEDVECVLCEGLR